MGAVPFVYRHRVNTLDALVSTPETMGIEFDLRSERDRIVITHDAFADGPDAGEFFARIGRRPCIFNVKCEGIEQPILELAAKHGIEDFFFLDLSLPAAVKLARRGERRLAVRYSEFEPLELAQRWKGLASWLWIDCFTRFPGAAADWAELGEHFKLCVVSPELQGHDAAADQALRAQLSDRRFHAVCSKVPARWGHTS